MKKFVNEVQGPKATMKKRRRVLRELTVSCCLVERAGSLEFGLLFIKFPGLGKQFSMHTDLDLCNALALILILM